MGKKEKIEFVVASDVGSRDGIGFELYIDGEVVMEVFRDDTARTREVALFAEQIALEYVEECIERFRREGLWEFAES